MFSLSLSIYIYCICIMYINIQKFYCFWNKSNLLYSPGLLFGNKYSKNSIILWIIIIIKNNCYSVSNIFWNVNYSCDGKAEF